MNSYPGDGPSEQGYSGYPPPPGQGVNTPNFGSEYGSEYGPGYGAPPYTAPGGPSYAGPSSNRGFDFNDLWQRWLAVLRHPSLATFDAQLPAANWPAIWISLFGLGVVQAIFGVITSFEYHRGAAAASIGDIIGAPIGFFIAAAIFFGLAKLFGGQGRFLQHCWVLSLIFVPLEAIAAIAGIIPILGGIIALAAGIYQIYLSVYAVASANRLSLGSATWVVLIPVIVVVVLVIVLAVVAAAILVALGLPGLR